MFHLELADVEPVTVLLTDIEPVAIEPVEYTADTVWPDWR